jgi:tetratricopeptide (TPR) repeat protein
LGQAQCLYTQGIYEILVCDDLEAAAEKFNHALKLHNEVGNVQGKADDTNKICEVLMRQGSLQEALTLISEALALHIQIDDTGGQADDLYIQASIFLEQSRYEDAELTMRTALKMHKQVKSRYGMARDLATLSDILWRRHENGKDANKSAEALTCIRQAMKLFKLVDALVEYLECMQQRRRMKGQEPLDTQTVDFNELSDDEDLSAYSSD